jgi:hypothetical protein
MVQIQQLGIHAEAAVGEMTTMMAMTARMTPLIVTSTNLRTELAGNGKSSWHKPPPHSVAGGTHPLAFP